MLNSNETIRRYKENLPAYLLTKTIFGLIGGKWNADKGKYDKWPVNARTGALARVNDPGTWSTFEEACLGLTKYNVLGIGIFLSSKLGIVCLDIDKVLNKDSGQPLPEFKNELQDILNHSEGTYLERSISANGIHLLFNAQVPGPKSRHSNAEMYQDKRFIALTCDVVDHRNEIKSLSKSNVDHLYNKYIDVDKDKTVDGSVTVHNQLNISDDKLIKLIQNSKGAEKFTDLMAGSWKKQGFPSLSEADLSLCSILAFWSQRNVAQMDRIYRTSKLYRPKWDEQHGEFTYGQLTIQKAVNGVESTYNPDIADRSHTDEGVRNRFLEPYGQFFLYGYVAKEFYYFNQKQWLLDKNGYFSHCLDAVIEDIKKEDPAIRKINESSNNNSQQSDNNSDKAEKEFHSFSRRYKNTNGKNAVKNQIKSYLTFDDTTFDTQDKVVNLNGILYDLADGTNRPVKASDHISKMIPVSPADNPTPAFDAFMKTSFQNHTELISFVMKLFGYALLGTNAEQIMVIFYGSGANGKSVLVDLMERLFADYSSRVSPSILTYSNTMRRDNNYNAQLADTKGTRIVITSEIEKGMMMDESTVKSLTGGELIRARQLSKSPISFKPTAVPLMTTNYLPTVKGTDAGIWRRILPIPMDHTVEATEMDPNLPNKLYQERSGILFKLIHACYQYQQEGLQIPSVCEKARAQYRQSMDTVGEFLSDTFIVTNNANDKVFNKELYLLFDQWNEDIDSKLSHQGLSKELQNRGFQKCKSGSKHGIRGLKLKDNVTIESYDHDFSNVVDFKPQITMKSFGMKYQPTGE